MAQPPAPEPQLPGELITAALSDLGAIVRRAQAETLDRDSFHELANRIRRRLKTARLMISEPEPTIELTDLGSAIGQLLESGQIKPGDLTTGMALLEAGPDRARTYGRLAVIDGGLNTPPQGA